MNVSHQQIEVEQVFPVKAAQATVDAEVALPGGLREEAVVYRADATVRMNGGESVGNRVTADGRVIFRVLYAQGDLNKIAALEASADFSQSLPLVRPIEGAQGLPADVRAEVLSVSGKAFGGRLMLSALVAIDGEVVARKRVSAVKSVDGADGVVQKTREVTLERETATGETVGVLRETVELPASLDIADSLYASADARVEDIHVGADGAAAVTGVICLEAYHYTTNRQKQLIKTRHLIPFEQTAALVGGPGHRVLARCDVRDTAVLLKESEGAPEMRVEVEMRTRVTSVEDEMVTLLEDAFLPDGDDLVFTAQPTLLRCGSVSDRASESARLTASLPSDAPAARAVPVAFVRPLIVDASASNGKMTIEGVAVCDILYLTDDESQIIARTAEESFRVTFVTDALPTDHLSLSAGEVEASAVTGDHIEIKCVLTLTADGVHRCAHDVATDVTTAPGSPPASGLTLYYLQPGESLWDVAKRYRLSPETLKAFNPDLPDAPASGAPVLLYRA